MWLAVITGYRLTDLALKNFLYLKMITAKVSIKVVFLFIYFSILLCLFVSLLIFTDLDR